jgi:lipopolysaccharide assembly protein A
MRQLNFVIIFVICLALVLFGIENTEPSAIQIIPGVQFQAPLSIELIMAMGIGAVLAWVFSVWTGLQGLLESRQVKIKLEEKEGEIQQLELDIEQYKAEIQEQQRLLPAGDPLVAEAEAS